MPPQKLTDVKGLGALMVFAEAGLFILTLKSEGSLLGPEIRSRIFNLTCVNVNLGDISVDNEKLPFQFILVKYPTVKPKIHFPLQPYYI